MKNKIIIPIFIIVLLLAAGAIFYQYWWVPREQQRKTEELLFKSHSCTRDTDCEIADFGCCPDLNPCGSKNLESVNKDYKIQLEIYLKSKCKEKCLPPAPPACTDCLKLEKITAVCTNNQCSIKKELNCKDYCKALVKSKSKTCPLISDDTLLTKENTKKCKCIVDETADWKTYRDTEYRFEVKYPKTWEVEKSKIATEKETKETVKKALSFSKIGQSRYPLGEYGAIDPIDILVTVGGIKAYRKIFPEKESAQNIKINNYSAIREEEDFGEIKYIIVNPKDNNILVTFTNYIPLIEDQMGSSEKKEANDTLNKMLSTFKFLD